MITHVIRLLRPADWTKNLFVFPAFIFSLPRLLSDEPEKFQRAIELLIPTLAAFIAFCAVASGFYAINDVLDVEKDRRHPIKRSRPVAAGQVAVRMALLLGAVLIIAGHAIAFVFGAALGLIIAAYAVLQILYNVRLKTVMFVDVTVLAIGFALRAAAGAVAIDVQVSIWLILCVFFLCLYLAFVKRLCDIASVERAGDPQWVSPAGYDRRDELNWLLGVSAVLAVVTYLMYSLSDQTWADFGVKSIGFALLTPLVLTAIHRVYRRASLGLSDSPFAAVIHDRTVLASVALFTAGVLVILFVPAVETIVETVFYFRKETGGAP